MENRLLNDDEAATLLGVSASFLRKARCVGTLGNATPPPPYVKIGRAVRYRRSDLDQWVAERVLNRSMPEVSRARR